MASEESLATRNRWQQVVCEELLAKSRWRQVVSEESLLTSRWRQRIANEEVYYLGIGGDEVFIYYNMRIRELERRNTR